MAVIDSQNEIGDREYRVREQIMVREQIREGAAAMAGLVSRGAAPWPRLLVDFYLIEYLFF